MTQIVEEIIDGIDPLFDEVKNDKQLLLPAARDQKDKP